MSELEAFFEFLFLHRAANLPAIGLAEIFDRLMWCLDDNVMELDRIRLKWLHGDNFDKVEIALAMKGLYPCEDRESMVQLFDAILQKWPILRSLCEEWLNAWDEQHSSQTHS